MLSYTDLSKSQKRWVDLVEQFFPGVKTAGELTYTDLKTMHDFFVSKRSENPGFKIAKPIWLMTNNAFQRGVYKFPASDVDLHVSELTEETELDIAYRAELIRHGITPK